MKSSNVLVLRKNMEGMLRYSAAEYTEFKRTGDAVLLQQAGEKLFNAVENFISFKHNIQVESFYEAKALVKHDAKLRKLLYDAKALHRFFYNGEAEMDVEDAKKLYQSVLARSRASIATVK